MNAKRKGNLSERRTRDWYLRAKGSQWDYTGRNDKKHGYGTEPATAVVKAGGSLGKFDLIVIFPHHHDYVQVKSNRWPSPAERASMIEDVSKYPMDVRIVCFRWDNRQSEPKIKFL
ncbi:unnamed protein product [marine sediment metagenome]|uniref:Uncharacterized protein n=1 Tax=marine sediment metagenome TaxID=412755 RepID=X1BFN6_9ZZZZ